MEFLGKHRLVPHPHFRPSTRLEVSVEASVVDGSTLFLTYRVAPAESLHFRQLEHGRQKNLWQSTCFEMFIKRQEGGYDEFNFAPPFAWDAYRFVDWRKGETPRPVAKDPHMVDSRIDDRRHSFPGRYELDALLDADIIPSSGGKASFAAVIEQVDGTTSYWAMAHPPGDAPNFHHPACFALNIPPARTS